MRRLYEMVRLLTALLIVTALAAQDRVNPHSAVLEEFQKRVTDYVNLEKDLAKGLPAAKPTTEPQTIIDRQHELAKKIRTARAKAHQGEIFTPDVATEFHRLMAFARQGSDNSHIKKSLERAEPVRLTLHVNDAYPQNIPLQSTPPTILANLPRLPPEVEYRIVGRTLVLRDITANIVVDLLPNAIP
jgi:hypothetical protein